MSDPKILQLQRDLKTLGFDPGELDGLMGSRTRGALHDWAGPGQWDIKDPQALGEVHKLAEFKRAQSVVGFPPNYHDLTAQASKDPRRGARPWSQVKGVTLHQTGCPMGESVSRWLGLKAHYGVTYSGQIYRVHPEEEMVWHAQQLSKTEIGIEISGFFCGIEGNPKTRPGGPKEWAVQSVTPQQVEAVKELVRYRKRLLQSHRGDLTHLHAHRQATDDRTPDPGSKVWKEIGLPLMAELGLGDGGPGWVVGKGQPIPEAWDSSRVGISYGKGAPEKPLLN